MTMLADFVLETASAPGTGATVNLAGAATGRIAFNQVFATGTTVYYFIDDGTQAEWGQGLFTSGSPNTLARTTVIGNTAGTTARLNFTGTVRVYNMLPALRAVYPDTTGVAATPGVFQAGPSATGHGFAQLTSGDASNPGFCAFFNTAGTRVGYVGFSDGSNNLALVAENGFGGWTCVTPFTIAPPAGSGALLAATQTSGTAITAKVTTAASALVAFEFSATVVGAITTNGSTTAYNTTSDYRLKVTFGLADFGAVIDSVPVHDAAFTADPTNRRPMFLAHELQASAPWAVVGVKDAVDEDGGIVPQQVDHSALVAGMWAEMQSLRRRVAALEARLG